MTIHSVPGEDVVVLCNQVYKLCNRIKGLRNPPDDLANVVSKCFLRSSNLTFNIHASEWHSKANKKTAEWRDVLEELKTVYESLAQSGEWDATNVKTPDAVTALKAEISALRRKVEEKKPSDSTPRQQVKTEIICHYCQEKGHIAPNCAKKAADLKKKGDEKPKSPYCTPPKDGESPFKNIDGVQCAWCGTCKKWTRGDKKHSTAEHKRKDKPAPMATATASSLTGNLAASEAFSGGLQLMQDFL